jgi:hypothetical protein
MRPAFSGLRSGAPNPIVLGRKFCPRCGRWRFVCDFGMTRRGSRLVARSYCTTCQTRSTQRALARRTPEQIARRREYHRIYAEVRRRARGTKPRRFNYDRANKRRRVTVVDHPEYLFLGPDPLLDEIERWPGTHRQLAQLAGVPERSLDRIIHGDVRHVRLDVADKLAVALGIPLSLIYVDAEPIRGRLPAGVRS